MSLLPNTASFGVKQTSRIEIVASILSRGSKERISSFGSFFDAQNVRDDLVCLIGRENEIGHDAVGGLEKRIQGHRRYARGCRDGSKARRLRMGRTDILDTNRMTFGTKVPGKDVTLLPGVGCLRVSVCDRNSYDNHCKAHTCEAPLCSRVHFNPIHQRHVPRRRQRLRRAHQRVGFAQPIWPC